MGDHAIHHYKCRVEATGGEGVFMRINEETTLMHLYSTRHPDKRVAHAIPLMRAVGLLALVFLILSTVALHSGVQASGFRFRGQPIVVKRFHPISTVNPNRPVLAFYYMWYHPSDWCSCHMSDLPTSSYTSSDDATVDRQVHQAASAGITGFISSWWGPGDQTDSNFVKLLAHSAQLEQTTGFHFASSLYMESDSPSLNSTSKMIAGLRYVLAHYSNNSNFFHWHGKPVLFFWNPLGNGRTLSQWAYIRSQVDPRGQDIWSAEGVDMNLLNVFDGIHLFSAGYWGILHGTMPAVDQGFRNQINSYNQAHHTQKIWAAGVLPGYDDTRIPGRTGTYIVPRNNGATYRTSWNAALASTPDWITVTTFNEWFEGAMIEPSVHYGNTYLTITQQFASKWHG